MIEMFCGDVKLYTSGISVQPQHVIVDFSFALINAILSSFNKCTLVSYLRTFFSILKQERSADDLVSRTYIALCIAHMIKALSEKLTIKEPNRHKRKSVLTLLATLAKTSTLNEAPLVCKNIYVVLYSEKCTPVVTVSKDLITNHITGNKEYDDHEISNVINDVVYLNCEDTTEKKLEGNNKYN